MLSLEELGPRICVMGASGSGKSTLADAISRKTGYQAVYLDTLYHRPGTAWRPRPPEEFASLHAEAVAGERWIIDGNYRREMVPRLRRATGVVWLDLPPIGCLLRYFARSWLSSHRHGRLEGAPDTVTWPMIRHIMIVQPASRHDMEQCLVASGLPLLRLRTMGAVRKTHESWALPR